MIMVVVATTHCRFTASNISSDWQSIGYQLCPVHTTNTYKTTLSCLVHVGSVNGIGGKSRLLATVLSGVERQWGLLHLSSVLFTPPTWQDKTCLYLDVDVKLHHFSVENETYYVFEKLHSTLLYLAWSNQPPRSTQPGRLSVGWHREYRQRTVMLYGSLWANLIKRQRFCCYSEVVLCWGREGAIAPKPQPCPQCDMKQCLTNSTH